MTGRARTRSRAAGGARRSAIATAVLLLAGTGRRGVIPGSAAGRHWWRDRNRTQPWDPAVDLERTVEFADDLTGNPVGWQLGPDLLGGAGAFGSTSAWSLTGSGASQSVSGGVLSITRGTTSTYSTATINTVIGKRYVVYVRLVSFNTNAVIRVATTAGGTDNANVTLSNAGLRSIDFVATAGVTYLSLYATVNAGEVTRWSAVTVQEVIRDESWLGANLVTNGDFSNGTTGWANSSTGAGSFTVSGAAATIVGTDASNRGAFSQNVGLVVGRCYQVTFNATVTSGSIAAFGSGASSGGSTISASGSYSLVLAAAASGSFFFYTLSGGGKVTIDNITVREIPGHPIVSAVSGSGLVGSKRVNLASQTEFRNGLTDAPIRGGLVSGTSLSGFAGAIAFGYDGVTDSYAYKNIPLVGGAGHRVSVVVEMADGLAPVFGSSVHYASTNDFVLVFNGGTLNPSLNSVTNLGNGKFRVTGTATAPASPGTYVGVVKYAGNSPRTFKVTAYDVRLAIWDSFNLPTYQRVGDGTAGVFDYDDAGFPLHLKNVTGTQAMMTLGTVDMSAGDAGVLLTNVVKLSDAVGVVVAETSPNFSANNGTLAIFAPTAIGSADIGGIHKGSSPSIPIASSLPSPRLAAIIVDGDISADLARLYINGVITSLGADQGTGNLGNHRLNIAGRDVGGTASLRFTGYYIGNLPALVAGDAGIDPLALSRELAAQGGLIY